MSMKIGEIMAADREITLNEGKKTVTVTVANKGDRQRVFGLNDLTRAQATDDTKAASMETAKLKGFL